MLKFSNLICSVTKFLVVGQVIKNKPLKEETIHFIVYSFFRSFIICFILTPIKLNELVDLVCVLFTPVQIPSSRTQYGRGVRGRRISKRKQCWKKIIKRQRELTSVRVPRNE